MTDPIRITGLRVDVVEWESIGFSTIDERGTVGPDSVQGLLRLDTANGIVGECFFGASTNDLNVALTQLSNVLGPLIVNKDLEQCRDLGASLPSLTGHGTTLRPGWAPIDIALWDIVGKTTGRPIADLLGRRRDRLPAYATHPPQYRDAQTLLDVVEQLVAEGFTAYKLHPGPVPVEVVGEFSRHLRTIGDHVAFMLDPNNRYTLEEALTVGRLLDESAFRWFEDPLPVGDIEGTLALARAIETPVAVSDSVSFDIPQMRFFANSGLRTLRASSRWFGITGLVAACETMRAVGGHCEIGLGGNPSMNAANLHVMASVDNCSYYEHWLPAERHMFGAVNPPSPEAGWINAPSGPGLGVVIDDGWVERHRVASI